MSPFRYVLVISVIKQKTKKSSPATMSPEIITRAVETDDKFPDIMRPVQNVVGNILRETYLSWPPSGYCSDIKQNYNAVSVTNNISARLMLRPYGGKKMIIKIIFILVDSFHEQYINPTRKCPEKKYQIIFVTSSIKFRRF